MFHLRRVRPGPPRGVHRRRTSRWWAAVGLAATMLTTSVVAAQPASADDQWQRCLNESSASLSFDKTTVSWLDSATIHWTVNAGPDCWWNALATFSVGEDTPQNNDNAQGVMLGVGTLSGSKSVTPLRNLPWRVWATSAVGKFPLATANITVTYPEPPPEGGPAAVRITDNSIEQRRQFVRAVETPGTKVTVAGDVSLDLSGLDGITVAPNTWITGDRSVNPAGPLLFTTTEPGSLFVVPRPANPAPPFSQEVISGIRLRGGSSTDPFDNMGEQDSMGITVMKPNVEIDHNEIYLWRGAGVEVKECDVDGACPSPDILRRPAPGEHATTVWIHDNYIHHDQHPAGDICCGHAAGYGVETSHGGWALIERNAFDYNRHSIASGWQPGTGYLLYRNLILPNGGVHSRVASTHAIDVHGSNKDDAYESGDAGEYFDVEYNTVWNVHGPAVKLRGTPSDEKAGKEGMQVRHNVFAHCGLFVGFTGGCQYPPALVQNETGMHESDTTLGVLGTTIDDARTSCDFDGDEVNDTFHATGVTWWFQSSRLAGRFVYLYQSALTGNHLVLGDRNADGLCDVTADGTTVPTDTSVVGTSIGVVPYVLGSTEAAARAAVVAAGLTVGTVTYQPSTTAAGLVIDQSPHWWYVRPAGRPVNLVVSLGRATVPNVLGMDQGSAQWYIGAAGLSAGTVSYTNNCVSPGSVQVQHPTGGALVAPGSTVDITLSTCDTTGGGGTPGGGGDKPPVREK
ncbi:PASTA domain-containing protein [Microbispora corallina]|nr:PASTA domain-containing protein [Microbispora corallina]